MKYGNQIVMQFINMCYIHRGEVLDFSPTNLLVEFLIPAGLDPFEELNKREFKRCPIRIKLISCKRNNPDMLSIPYFINIRYVWIYLIENQCYKNTENNVQCSYLADQHNLCQLGLILYYMLKKDHLYNHSQLFSNTKINANHLIEFFK